MNKNITPSLNVTLTAAGTILALATVPEPYEQSERGLLLYLRDTGRMQPENIATLLGCSVHTLKNFHQGRRMPESMVWRLAAMMRLDFPASMMMPEQASAAAVAGLELFHVEHSVLQNEDEITGKQSVSLKSLTASLSKKRRAAQTAKKGGVKK